MEFINKKAVGFVTILITLIIVNLVINSSLNGMNEINKNNTFEQLEYNQDKTIKFVNEYVNNIKNNLYTEQYSKLNESTKKLFNNSTEKYTSYIQSKSVNLNKTDNGIEIKLVKIENINKYTIYYYDIKSLTYQGGSEYYLFKSLKIIEYSPNVYSIYIDNI